MKLANRFYNSASGRKEAVVITDIVFVCNGVEYSILELTDNEVCILVPQRYANKGTLLLPCWFSKDKGQVVEK